MASVWAELQRRNVIKVAVAYSIVAWLSAQLAEFATATFGAPDWVLQTFVVFLILGLPLALILAWAYEMTPEGIKAAAGVPRDSITSASGQRLNYVILGLVVLAVGFLVVDQYVFERGAISAKQSSMAVPPQNVGPVGRSITDYSASLSPRYSVNLGPVTRFDSSGVLVEVAFSPDGRRIVYSARRDGQSLLYLRELDEIESQPIVGSNGAQTPSFSTDGEWIGFHDGGALKRISVHGGIPQTVAEDQRIHTSSFWTVAQTVLFTSGDGSLRHVPAAGGTSRPLLEVQVASVEMYAWPQKLSGSEDILITISPADGARNGKISLLSMEDDEVQDLIEGGYNARYVPTGHIVFMRSGALWAVPFDLERLEIVGPEVPVVQGLETDGFRGDAAYAFSSAGRLIYLPGGENLETPLRTLVWVDRDGREELVDAEARFYRHPRISPNGQQLAFSSNDAGNREIWVHDLVRNISSLITFYPLNDRRPLWTPSGERIVFASVREGGGLFSKAADGTGQATRLTESYAIEPDSFSPDGTQLVVRTLLEGHQWDLHLLAMDGEPSLQPLLTTPFNEYLASISPDGRWLAYTSDETGRDEVYVRPFPDVDRSKWRISGNGGTEAVWTSDGGELVFRSGEAMMIAAVETEPEFSAGIPTVLFEGEYADSTNPPSYDISLDGQRFVMIKENGEIEAEDWEPQQTSLIVIENWFEELNRLAPPSP